MPEDVKFDQKAFDKIIEDQNKNLDAIQESLKGTVKAEELKVISESLDTVKDSLSSIEMVGEVKLTDYITKMQTQANNLEQELETLKTKRGLGVKSFEEKLSEIVNHVDFKSSLKNKQVKEFTFDTKAAMDTSDFTSDAGTTDLLQMNLPGVNKSPWMKTPLFAGVTKRPVGEKVGSIRYSEEVSKTNSAAFLAEGATLAQSEAGWIARTENFYKAGHYVTFSEEMLEDNDYVMGELNDLLRNGLLQEVNKQMWLGDGSGADEILGIINTTAQVAKDFAKPWNMDETVANPSIWDVFYAGKLQVSNGVDTDGTGDQAGYMANTIFVNPCTMTDMKTAEKDTTNRPLWKEYMTGDNVFDGMTIVEDRRVPAGKFVVADSTQTTAYIKRNLTIKTSENVASQFLADQLSVKATMRLAYITKVLSRYAWVYGDIETAKGLISAD